MWLVSRCLSRNGPHGAWNGEASRYSPVSAGALKLPRGLQGPALAAISSGAAGGRAGGAARGSRAGSAPTSGGSTAAAELLSRREGPSLLRRTRAARSRQQRPRGCGTRRGQSPGRARAGVEDVVSREHLPQLEKIQEVLPSRRDEAHFR